MSTCREIGIEPRSDLVEDCGAELMANLFHNDMAGLRRFEGRSKLSTWLTVVVRRTALRIIHRRLRDADKIAVPDSRFDFATIAGANDSEDSPYDTEDNERLQAALQQLSASDRQIIELQFDQQLSYSAIGQIFNISENAVGPKLHRAQTRLKKLLKRQEDE
jgi:RNA polymerase sigma-70 factor (ECF subfamily)